MFTGIIEQQGKKVNFSKSDTGARLVLEKPQGWETNLGDSISVQGACLTIAQQDEKTFSFDLMPETLRLTTFGIDELEQYNLEPATSLDRKLDGHMVSGHVDTVGNVLDVKDDNGEYVIRVSFDKKFASLVIMKGSITIDGVSLTVTGIGDAWCEVSLVPYTLEHTTLGELQKGGHVNIEFDMIGKYINRFMEIHHAGE